MMFQIYSNGCIDLTIFHQTVTMIPTVAALINKTGNFDMVAMCKGGNDYCARAVRNYQSY